LRSDNGTAGGCQLGMNDLVPELSAITIALKDRGVDYALCGGLSMAVHGFPRATMDIDLLIRPESLESAYAIAAEHGFDIRGLDMSFKERAVEIRRVSKIIGEDVLSLDLLLVTPQVEDVWETREAVEFQGNSLTVVSRTGLLKMKRLAGRPQDLADIYRIENEED
jgi:predicted amino acid-binding ACT domain protein